LDPTSSTETLCRFARSFLRLVGPEGPSVGVLDSSLGVHQRSPLRQYRCRVSTPGWAEARPSARSCQTPDAFRPCRSSRLRRFTPLDTLQVCCTLHPAMGFAMFPVCPGSLPEGSGLGLAFPTAPHPTELSPPQQVGARHRVPIPSRRCSRFPVVGPPVLPRLAPRPSAVRSASGFCSTAKSVASSSALPPAGCPMLPWAWSQAGSPMLLPAASPRSGGWLVPLWSEDRAGAGRGWSLCGPKTARGPSVGAGRVVALPEGRLAQRPVVDLTRSRGPEGRWFRLRPSAGWPRGTGRCSRLAGRPRAVALLAPRFVRTRGPRRVLVGRAAEHPGVPGRRARVRPRGDAPLPSSPAAGVP
jgi:hypothetical protein